MKRFVADDDLSKIMADADMSNLGKDSSIYWQQATNLLQEIRKSDFALIENDSAFAAQQVSVISNHKFFTPEAKKLFPNSAKNYQFTLSRLRLGNKN